MSRLLQGLDAFIVARSKNSILVSTLLTAVAVGALTYYIQADLLILFLAPVFLASWYAGWRYGAVVAVYSAASAFVTETLIISQVTGGQFEPRLILTLLVRLAAYLVIARTIARLHETQRQQEELTNFIVHDLRSPLASSITGLMTLQQTSDALPDHDREMVDLALVSNERALSLVNSILDVAKLESGTMSVAPQEVFVREFVDDSLKQVELWARGHGITLEQDVHLDRAVLDPDLTSRVLVNLLGNALKFSPDEGTVVVRAAMHHGAVRFSVVDHGPGIPPEAADLIFEPFGQVKGTQGGTGLGLTFCRLAVHAQGGRIWVESHVGKGTTMHFTIPQHGHHPHTSAVASPSGQ